MKMNLCMAAFFFYLARAGAAGLYNNTNVGYFHHFSSLLTTSSGHRTCPSFNCFDPEASGSEL